MPQFDQIAPYTDHRWRNHCFLPLKKVSLIDSQAQLIGPRLRAPNLGPRHLRALRLPKFCLNRTNGHSRKPSLVYRRNVDTLMFRRAAHHSWSLQVVSFAFKYFYLQESLHFCQSYPPHCCLSTLCQQKGAIFFVLKVSSQQQQLTTTKIENCVCPALSK